MRPNLAEALRLERTRRGWSQRELARRTGVSQANISVIESGKSDPQLSTLTALAAALELELQLVPRGRARLPGDSAAVPEVPLSVLDEVRVPDPEEDDEEEGTP